MTLNQRDPSTSCGFFLINLLPNWQQLTLLQMIEFNFLHWCCFVLMHSKYNYKSVSGQVMAIVQEVCSCPVYIWIKWWRYLYDNSSFLFCLKTTIMQSSSSLSILVLLKNWQEVGRTNIKKHKNNHNNTLKTLYKDRFTFKTIW